MEAKGHSSGSKPKVMVTGATGYIGMWVIKKALEQGKYHIVATMRGPKDKENPDDKFKKKVKDFLEAVGGTEDTVTIRYADLLNRDDMIAAAEGCKYIIHLASPFPQSTPKDAENTVIKPAVEGAIYAMEAAHKNGVKRIVLTSSIAAIMNHTSGDIVVDETSWPPNADELTPYYRSKIRAEEEAIKYLQELKEEEKFELVRLNPGVVYGPLLTKEANASTKTFKEMMDGSMFSIPKLWFPLVDVRDVADGHLRALEKPVFDHSKAPEESKDEKSEDSVNDPWTIRIALIEGTYYFPDVGKAIDRHFRKLNYKPTTGAMYKLTIWLGSFFNEDAAQFRTEWNVNCTLSNQRSKDVLGMDYLSQDDSLVDMGYSFINLGVVENKLTKEQMEDDPKITLQKCKRLAQLQ